MNRPNWHEYFFELVAIIAKRSTCLRRQIGALIVKDKQIITTGYNGVPNSLKHCTDRGCLREQQNIPSGERHELCRGLHAEMNAIIQAANYGISVKNAVIYTTHYPCILCVKMIINCNIKKIYTKTT